MAPKKKFEEDERESEYHSLENQQRIKEDSLRDAELDLALEEEEERLLNEEEQHRLEEEEQRRFRNA